MCPGICCHSAAVWSLLPQNKDAYEPFCKVPVITSSKEEQKLIATSNKVRETGMCCGESWGVSILERRRLWGDLRAPSTA